MSDKPKSRWADDEEDAAAITQKKAEKEAKKRAKAERQRQIEANADAVAKETIEDFGAPNGKESQSHFIGPVADTDGEYQDGRSAKRRKQSPSRDLDQEVAEEREIEESHKEGQELSGGNLLDRFPRLGWNPCRHVDNFDRLNHIEEGSYGWVSRAKDINTEEIVALKKLKMENSNDGFPVTGLREIQTLMASKHPNIVDLREVVMGNQLDEVYLVMEFLEHDLRTLQEDMLEPFLASEVKTLLLQLTSAVQYLHDNWILHRDLKTSNILMNNRGQIKIADFGMARYYGDPPPKLTQLVVTLWYRAPELLLGAEEYGPAIDLWSIGCIFGELLRKSPMLQGKNEVDQLTKIFELRGLPTESNWPGFRRLPNARALRLPSNPDPRISGSVVRAKFPFLTSAGTDLLSSLLSLNPADRPTAREILQHPYFKEDPRPKNSAMFPTFPSKARQEKRRRILSPNAPKRGDAPRLGGDEVDLSSIFAARDAEQVGGGFSLKLV